MTMSRIAGATLPAQKTRKDDHTYHPIVIESTTARLYGKTVPGEAPMRVLTLAAALAAGLWCAPAPAADVPTPANYGQAMRWYDRAAEAGHVRAQFYLGLMLETGVRGPVDVTAAAAWYRQAARQGHVQAQYKLGLLHYEGRGVPRDLARAAHWYGKAAQGGSAPAQYNLALMYERGRGVAADAARAARWYEKAAENGVGAARLNLSALYARGTGVRKDPVRALMWLDLAVAGGLDVEPDVRDGLTVGMSPGQIEDAGRRARERLGETAPAAGGALP